MSPSRDVVAPSVLIGTGKTIETGLRKSRGKFAAISISIVIIVTVVTVLLSGGRASPRAYDAGWNYEVPGGDVMFQD